MNRPVAVERRLTCTWRNRHGEFHGVADFTYDPATPYSVSCVVTCRDLVDPVRAEFLRSFLASGLNEDPFGTGEVRMWRRDGQFLIELWDGDTVDTAVLSVVQVVMFLRATERQVPVGWEAAYFDVDKAAQLLTDDAP